MSEKQPYFVSSHEKELITADYLSGDTFREVADEFNRGIGTCKRALKLFDNLPRNRSQASRIYWSKNRKYEVDEAFFDKIDTEEKAYWLGFISADGNVSGNSRIGKCLCIVLQEKDKNHLLKFKRDIKSMHPIYKRTTVPNSKSSFSTFRRLSYTFYGISIGSVRLVDALINLGVVPKKSLIIKACDRIPLFLERHYWRGVIDGDGCLIHKFRENKEIFSLSLVSGSPIFLKNFSDFLVRNGVLSSGYSSKMSLSFGYANSRQIIHLLYKNANVFLERKMRIAFQVFEHIKTRKFKKNDYILSNNSKYLSNRGEDIL